LADAVMNGEALVNVGLDGGDERMQERIEQSE
jgi:hypothetical protein